MTFSSKNTFLLFIKSKILFLLFFLFFLQPFLNNNYFHLKCTICNLCNLSNLFSIRASELVEGCIRVEKFLYK